MYKLFRLLSILIIVFSIFGCKNDNTNKSTEKESVNTVSENKPNTKINRKKLTPAEEEKANSLMSRLIVTPALKNFASYAVTANMAEKLGNEKGPFLVFAPSNSAIKELPSEKKKYYSNQNNRLALEDLLKSHIVQKDLDGSSLIDIIKKEGKVELKALNGVTLVATEDNGKIVITDNNGAKATILKRALPASNGAIFMIDQVMNLP